MLLLKINCIFAKHFKMLKQINDIFHEDGKTTDELLNHYKICKTSYSDVVEIVNILTSSFYVETKRDAVRQLLYSNADLDNSVKLIDERDGKIYGLLIFSKFNISEGSPIRYIDKTLNDALKNKTQINGHSFVIDKRLRGFGVDIEMLKYQEDYLKDYDFVWCGVETDLKTHKYWERIGFIKMFETIEAKFYIMPNNKKLAIELFMLKLLSDNGEKNNINL